jgi:hypothetical protein
MVSLYQSGELPRKFCINALRSVWFINSYPFFWNNSFHPHSVKE